MKYRFWGKWFVALIVFVFSVSGCVDIPKDLIVPEWDVDLNVPILNRSYILQDIIKNQDYIHIQQTTPTQSIYVIQSDKYSQSVGVSQFIRVTSPTSSRNNIVPAGNFESQHIYLPFPEGAELDTAKFVSGNFALHIYNPSAVSITYSIKIPGIIKPDGTQFSIQETVQPNQEDSSSYNFSDCTYILPPNQQSNLKDNLQLIVNAASSVLVGPYLILDFYSSDFLFSSVTGKLPNKSLGVRTESFALNLGDAIDYRNKVFLKEAKLNMDLLYKSVNNNPFEIGIENLNIIAKRKDGTTLLLKDINGNPNISFKFESGYYHSSFTSDNSNITDFIAFLPDSVLLVAEYIMNPDNKYGSASIQDSIEFQTDFSTESLLSFKKSTITDTSNIEINKDDRDKIKDGEGVNVSFEIKNGIPLSVWLNIVITDEHFNPLFTVKDKLTGVDSIFFPGAEVDQNGEVINPVLTTSVISLDPDEIQKLSRAYHAVVSISAMSKNAYMDPPPAVAIRPNDQLSVKIFGGVKYRVKPNN